MKFLKKHYSNIIFGIFIILMIIPQTRKPIQVQIQRLIAFSPSTISEEKRETLNDFDWPVKTLTGQNTNINKSKNKVTFINLWATWCPPCIAEKPSFQALYNDYADKVDFYFISSENTNTINKFLEQNNYQLPIYQPLSAPPAQLNSRALPTTYVIDKQGNIVVERRGVANWNSNSFRAFLDQLLE